MPTPLESLRKLIVISGPTASGKTAMAVKLAKLIDAQIVSADSRQFYKEMKIGTAVPSDFELEQVKHHFIGNLSIFDKYDVSRYEADALSIINQLFDSHDYVILCGGSGLYIDAVTKGIDALPDPDPDIRKNLKDKLENEGIEAIRNLLKVIDPDFYNVVDLANPIRIIRAIEVYYATGTRFSQLRSGKPKQRDFHIFKFAVNIPRNILYQRINSRVDQMMDNGLLDEARHLKNLSDLTALNTLGYKELFDYLDGICSLDFAVDKIKTNTRRYAKRQITWINRDNEYISVSPDDEGINTILSQIQSIKNNDNLNTGLHQGLS
ncbi:MAG: tRNA (adenosine(37)-N6)-dimethylallyltransferase MiaA [Bacteroidales bacterium]|jgi:tRNA dimethylallyltransferase|nr:tRNA (adenosine(37)-N6)-dimethylallyltransferase MiaA [Bacteroidales bacterium]MDD2204188.1 tRNA (adenosine(37)-N6)-dimethylallyltransferase MiaA [Bacteroidales bacterium]MDD3152305.1 tRNA (adenosine(37)-N6)-dimethylallyltransferase MiaA [Bacteroidales bacterium]MDD3913639.1 tRNA (adenosine(37)-N6)-dimethylallyltransferase MiaA [Bacteroidales bacterium]MDD4634716.1 tRNA (adenosine(37)-N6)-dimethylallyltransferase MiaA [Bacteroidales bacterium]